MSNLYKAVGRKLMFGFDAEQAHGLSIKALQSGAHPRFDGTRDKRLGIDVAGLHFPNPIGMAAGYDKGADVPDALIAMGFGHTEVGTITPRPQPGNDKPRVFRLLKDEAVINRLGFNSGGHAAALAKLRQRDRNNGIVGVNIGANKTSEDFGADYVEGIETFADLATYFTVNISSPNTPGLRALQGADPLADLLSRVDGAVEKFCIERDNKPPVFLKIAPDLTEDEMDAIAKALEKSSVDALIVSNTTLSREGLRSTFKSEAGGLSGKPLFERSTIVLAKMRQRVGNTLPLVGVGGVHNGATALSKLEAGASLVQLYTGLIYEGPGLPGTILRHLSKQCDSDGITDISSIIGRKCEDWAAKPLT